MVQNLCKAFGEFTNCLVVCIPEISINYTIQGRYLVVHYLYGIPTKNACTDAVINSLIQATSFVIAAVALNECAQRSPIAKMGKKLTLEDPAWAMGP